MGFQFVFLDPPTHVNSKLGLVMRPELFPVFAEIAEYTKLSFDVGTNDLQSVIEAEKPLKQRKAGFSLEQYNDLDEIYKFLDDTAASFPEKVSVFNLGETFEGRLMRGLKISTSERNPGVFIESNIHAREWISSATSLWIINEILTSQDPIIRELVDSVTWYFLPITNPDGSFLFNVICTLINPQFPGFSYTHTTDRLWRKNRSIHNILCRGVDPNRNFGFNWLREFQFRFHSRSF